MAEPYPGLRLNVFPARPASVANVGFQVNPTTAELEAAAAIGATSVRWQPGWNGIEDFETGELALPAEHSAALATCARLGLRPLLVAAYGPPFEHVADLEVSAEAKATQRTVKVADASGVEPLRDFLMHGKGQITQRWAYYGSVIEAAGEGQITLGAEIVPKPLAAGEVLQVNRLRYLPLYGAETDSEGIAAYLRYASFLGEQIAAAGCVGYVCLWNEDVWAHDKWDHGSLFFDTPPSGVHGVDRMSTILAAALEVELPEGVGFISGATDKSGASSILWEGLDGPRPTSRGQLAAEGMHEYGENPESQAWDPRYHPADAGDKRVLLNPEEDSGSTFHRMYGRQVASGLGISTFATEDGYATTDDERQAVYLIRRLLTHWGEGVGLSSIYSLASGPAYGVQGRPSAEAILRLIEIARSLGGDGGDPESIPALVGVPDLPFPLLTAGVYGTSGGALFVWQRSHRPPKSGRWEAVPSPVPGPIDLYLPKGYAVDRALNVRTGESVQVDVEGSHLRLPEVSDDVIAVVSR